MKNILLSLIAISSVAQLHCMQPAARLLCRSANRLALRQTTIPATQFFSQPRPLFVAQNNLLAPSTISAFSTTAQQENQIPRIKQVVTVQNIQDTIAFLNAVETHLRSTGKANYANDIAAQKESIISNGIDSTKLDHCFRTLIESGIVKDITFSSQDETPNARSYKLELVNSLGSTICTCAFIFAVFAPAFFN